jgi:hypothetical protein
MRLDVRKTLILDYNITLCEKFLEKSVIAIELINRRDLGFSEIHKINTRKNIYNYPNMEFINEETCSYVRW